MTTPTANTPAIRFRGFNEPWERRTLNELFDFTVPHYNHSRDMMKSDGGCVFNIHYGDILIKYGSVVRIGVDSVPFLSEGREEDYKSSKLNDGDILFADTAEDSSCGKTIEIRNCGTRTIIAGLHTIVIRANVKYAPYYLGYYFNSYTYHDQLLPLMQGIKVLSINKPSLENTIIYYPTNYAEQQKIGAFFRQQDEAIDSSKQQITKLKTIKQACLQGMFA